jgi:hypothetical protein
VHLEQPLTANLLILKWSETGGKRRFDGYPQGENIRASKIGLGHLESPIEIVLAK